MADPPESDAVQLTHALGLLAREWGCSHEEAQDRLLKVASRALLAAGADQSSTDPASQQLIGLMLRRDLDGFDACIQRACRRSSTAEDGPGADVSGQHRRGWEDDGPLRSVQSQAAQARKDAAQATVQGSLAAVDYALVSSEVLRRKRTLLRNRLSATFLGWQVTRDEAGGVQQPKATPLWRIIVTAAVLIPLAIPAAPFLLAAWLLLSKRLR